VIRTIVFIGPTDGVARARLAPVREITVAPPAERGDVEKARKDGYERIVLVDGYFYQHLSVGHRELRHAIDSGIRVVGMASLGAIRAVELASLGMVGYGRVYAAFAGNPSLPDDEVALLHASTEPYRAASEPLIHLRAWLSWLTEQRFVTVADRDGVLDQLTRCWFGDRTIAGTCMELSRRCGVPVRQLHAWAAGFDRHRWKAKDWRDFEAAELGITQSEARDPLP
jgi:hypothetical protein